MHNEINRSYFVTNTVFQSRIISSKESKKPLTTTRHVWPTTKDDEGQLSMFDHGTYSQILGTMNGEKS